MQIIDIHAHVFPDAIAQRAADSIGDFYHLAMSGDGTIKGLTERMREAGIERAVIHSVAVTPGHVENINRFIAGTVLNNDGKLTGFGTVHPECGDIASLIDNVISLGLKGLKIHPDMQKFALDDDHTMQMFEAIEGRLPVLIHTGDKRYAYSGPRQMHKVLKAFPKMICICAHLGGWSEWNDAWKCIAGFENAYIDTSSSLYALDPTTAAEIIHHYAPERVLFGTDYPMWDPDEEIERFLQLPLTDAEKERILCTNALRFL